MSKKLETFEDVVAWATWHIITSITQGVKLEIAVNNILTLALQWKIDRNRDATRNPPGPAVDVSMLPTQLTQPPH